MIAIKETRSNPDILVQLPNNHARHFNHINSLFLGSGLAKTLAVFPVVLKTAANSVAKAMRRRQIFRRGFECFVSVC
jgi:hypothetical protein